MANLQTLVDKILSNESTPGRLSLSPTERTQLVAVSIAARALVTKLGQTLKWQDRGLGFNEWRNLAAAIDGDTMPPQAPIPSLAPYAAPPLPPLPAVPPLPFPQPPQPRSPDPLF